MNHLSATILRLVWSLNDLPHAWYPVFIDISKVIRIGTDKPQRCPRNAANNLQSADARKAKMVIQGDKAYPATIAMMVCNLQW